jgi:hypothetical protein
MVLNTKNYVKCLDCNDPQLRPINLFEEPFSNPIFYLFD